MPVLSTVGAASLGAFGAFKGFGAAGGFIVATGGTIYVDPTDANYKIHEFTTSGTFTVTTAPTGATLALLLVAGGGSGDGGGGGAGGYIYRSSFPVSEGSYAVEIGAAGDPTGSALPSGGNSVFAGLYALGGGSQSSSTSSGYGGSGAGGYEFNLAYPYGGLGLQPTSASGGYGNNGARAGGGFGYGSGGGGGAGGAPSNNVGGSGRTADIINSSGAYETMAAGGWGTTSVATALPAVGYGTGGWGGRKNDSNGNYLDPGYGGAGILRVRYKFQ
jgi:hypothetical protein